MSSSEQVRPMLAARAATDPDAARLLEMFTRAEEIVGKRSQKRIGNVKAPKLFSTSTTNGYNTGRAGSVPRPQVNHGD